MLSSKQQDIINQILSSSNLRERYCIYKEHIYDMKDISLLLFDIELNKQHYEFENREIQHYKIIGLGDYSNIFVLNRNFVLSNHLYIEIYRHVELDLNIWSFIYKLNSNSLDESLKEGLTNLIECINSDRLGFLPSCVAAHQERLLHNDPEEYTICMIKAFNDTFNKYDELLRNNEMAQHLLSNEVMTINRKRFEYLYCALLKAYSLKRKRKSLSKAKNSIIEDFISYCVDELLFNSENEIILISQYILDHTTNMGRTFSKMDKSYRTIGELLEKIKNTALDIMYLRNVESTLNIYNCIENGRIFLPYIVTDDTGLQQAFSVNPIIAFVLSNGSLIPIHKYKIQDVCKNTDFLKSKLSNDYLEIRRRKFPVINYRSITTILEKEIEREYFNDRK